MNKIRTKRTAEPEEAPTSTPTPSVDVPIRRAPLPEAIRKQLSRWAVDQRTDGEAAKQIGISTRALVCARMGRTMSQRVQWKITEFLKHLPVESESVNS